MIDDEKEAKEKVSEVKRRRQELEDLRREKLKKIIKK